MSYIFTAGSCQKKDFYDFLLNSMTAAGWKNISSKVVTDGDVMFSEGKDGDKKIFIRLFPYWYRGVIDASSNTNFNIRTTGNYSMGIQLQQNYTPGASGIAGTFYDDTRKVKSFQILINQGTTYVPLDAIVQYRIYIDKSKVILFTAVTGYGWVLNYFGLPDTLYAKCDMGRGNIYASTAIHDASAVMKIMMSAYPDEGHGISPTPGKPYEVDCAAVIPSISPNRNGKYFLNDFYVQSAAYGMIAKLEGVLGVGGLYDSDTVVAENGKNYNVITCTADTYTYTICNDAATSNMAYISNSFKTYQFAIEVG